MQGAALENTPEFASYRRTYAPLWEVIALLIKQLEAVCKQVSRLVVRWPLKQLRQVSQVCQVWSTYSHRP